MSLEDLAHLGYDSHVLVLPDFSNEVAQALAIAVPHPWATGALANGALGVVGHDDFPSLQTLPMPSPCGVVRPSGAVN